MKSDRSCTDCLAYEFDNHFNAISLDLSGIRCNTPRNGYFFLPPFSSPLSSKRYPTNELYLILSCGNTITVGCIRNILPVVSDKLLTPRWTRDIFPWQLGLSKLISRYARLAENARLYFQIEKFIIRRS